MFENFDEAANDALAASRHECIRLRAKQVLPEHLILGIARDPQNMGARALSSMNIGADEVRQEVERAAGVGEKPGMPHGGTHAGLVSAYESITFSEPMKKVFERANDFRLFFGRQKVGTEHLLLGIIDGNEDGALKVLDELGANLTFLRRQVLALIAREDSLNQNAPQATTTVLGGISELVLGQLESIENIRRLAQITNNSSVKLPERSDIVLMVFLAYLPDFLLTQVAYQRYLLEETIKVLSRRTGTIDKEVIATIISQTAQNLRSEVRAIIDRLWSQEDWMLCQMPDEAEHEEIGSVIEDIWWTYSEEIALHEVFDEALDDYRRKHVLNLQKRKLEISHRLVKIKQRFEETLRNCLTKRSVSA